MIVDSKTGKILVTSKQLLKNIKEYLNSFTDEEWVERLKKRKQRLTYKGVRDDRAGYSKEIPNPKE